MNSVTCNISMSLDGFVAGPNPSFDDPLGEGGEGLHEWAFGARSWREAHGREGGERGPDSDVIDEVTAGVGAHIMGRRMFGGGDGPWDESWKGWWGDDPPFHTPVFVLTHHPREPLPMEGGTTFAFVTDGIESALEQAREAAGGKDVSLAGGAKAAQQYLAKGLVDQMEISLVPTLLGTGERLFEGLGDDLHGLQLVRTVAAPQVTHLRFSR